MTRAAALLLALLAAACAARVPAPDEDRFARALIARAESSPPRAERATAAPGEIPIVPPRTEADLIDDFVLLDRTRLSELRAVATDDGALAALLESPPGRDELAALAVLRSPDVAAARARSEAARTGYAQSADLADLVSIYRSFATEGSVPAVASYPDVTALSGEIVTRTVAIAFEDLRAAVAGAVADAERVHADAARLAAAIRIRTEDLTWNEARLGNLRARLESGRSSQAAYLAFAARVETLRTELGVLVSETAVVRARTNRLLRRPEAAPVALPTGFAAAPAIATDPLTTERNPRVRTADLQAERAQIAVRLAETMTLPRLDVASARHRRDRAAFGVREAQVGEMRARADAAVAARIGIRDRAATELRTTIVAVAAAADRVANGESETVPLTAKALEAALGSFEGGGGGYLDLLTAAERNLSARLSLADARRQLAHARADLIRVTGAHPEVSR